MQEYYPSHMGNFCDAWDGKMDYCMGAEAEDWCPMKWCYVSQECADAAMGSYLSEQGEPQLYYSYGACGDEDTYTGTDSDPCACIGNQDKAEQQDYYPLTMGDMCDTWDAMMDYCQVAAPADYCDDPWCYTSDKCPGAAAGTYFADEEGPQLYYNYAVCGAEDEYTGTEFDPLTDERSTDCASLKTQADCWPAMEDHGCWWEVDHCEFVIPADFDTTTQYQCASQPSPICAGYVKACYEVACGECIACEQSPSPSPSPSR
jgi:hypothetical protein